MSTEAMKLPPMPEPEGFADPSCGGFMAYTADQMRDFALQARAQVQGEPFGYIHHFAAHDERGALIDTTWEADGCADPLPHPTFPAMWKWSHCTPFYTTQRPTQATQATDYVGGEPDGIVIGFHEGNALVDHAGNLEEGNCLFLSPTIPTQATQAEVTDSMIREAFLANGFTIKDGHSDLKPYVYAAARAILALRPERVPMTPDRTGLYAWVSGAACALVLVNQRPSDFAPGGQFNGHVIDSTRFYNGCAVVDWGRDGNWTLLHDLSGGITAQAKKEQE